VAQSIDLNEEINRLLDNFSAEQLQQVLHYTCTLAGPQGERVIYCLSGLAIFIFP